jgi:hypothetical protein
MKRSFHGGHSLHGATMDMRKKPRASMGSTAGQVLARFGQGELSPLSQFGRSGGARRQPSETTHAMVRQKKAPREWDSNGARARLGWGARIKRA